MGADVARLLEVLFGDGEVTVLRHPSRYSVSFLLRRRSEQDGGQWSWEEKPDINHIPKLIFVWSTPLTWPHQVCTLRPLSTNDLIELRVSWWLLRSTPTHTHRCAKGSRIGSWEYTNDALLHVREQVITVKRRGGSIVRDEEVWAHPHRRFECRV